MISASMFESALRRFFAPVGVFLDDPTVSELMINGPADIFVERRGRVTRTDARFDSIDELLGALRVIAQYVGRPFDEAHPILEARLPDGSRVEALLAPIAAGGPAVAIRRFAKGGLTMEKLLEYGALTQGAAETLSVLVESKRNIVVAGGTGSGKTSLLNALSAHIPPEERVVVIEDSRELELRQGHVVSLEARPPDAKGRGAVTIRDLFKATLRMRPDRIILGEIRGGEALDMIQAMTSGHGGCLSTVHATYPIDALNRLETMALMSGVELPLLALRAQLVSAVDFIVQTSRLRDGRRVVTHVTEVGTADPQKGYALRDLFSLSARGATREARELRPTGHLPECLDAIHAVGLELPRAMFDAAKARSTTEGSKWK